MTEGETKNPLPPVEIQHESAFFDWRAHLLLWILVVAGFAADRASKSWALDHLGQPGQDKPTVYWVIKNSVSFELTGNRGAVWGVAHGKTGFLVGVSFLALVFLLYLFIKSKKGQFWFQGTVGILLSGALGNLYDRLFHEGIVIDFIKVDLGFWPANPWPIFNIADICICLGIGMFFILMLFGQVPGTKDKQIKTP